MPTDRGLDLPQGGLSRDARTAAKGRGAVTGNAVGSVQDREPTDPAAFYASALEAAELADLVAFAGDLTLDDEIACARIALRRVLAVLSADGAPPDGHGEAEAAGAGLTPAEYARLAALAFQGTSTVARLLRDRRALCGDAADGISAAIGQALDELSSEWGIEL